MYLAFGASRTEACRPIAVEALRLALTPSINSMRCGYLPLPSPCSMIPMCHLRSVIGIIAIPGMMTGAILGGSSVTQAAKLQMVIQFMNSASTALASIFTTAAVFHFVVDTEHRVRGDRIDEREHVVWRARDAGFAKVVGCVKGVGRWLRGRTLEKDGTREENEPLLSG